MTQFRLTLAALALVGWTGTIVSQLVALLATSESERIEWTERRNLFLLCSSLATNTLVFTVVCRAVQRRLRR
ncbi:hypothetical protein G6M89_03465 [Natronolimnobius sp. AArcel1]|uniref:hypothetical protein n=1 Tax=Natronolimnobius sp. AArcel1 TaxID=1679093 RepID=UPI0013EE16C1|nr:hypothetical protein [Natronolimnobius sp. AArcel1]NGM68079.1 hypothetical protein [Natronolimnobius sp. AArcel1]